MLEPTTDAGRAGLAALRADPSRALVALDYDGTLAPVVERPDEAVPADGALDVLAGLAARVGRVALVTGRPPTAARRTGPARRGPARRSARRGRRRPAPAGVVALLRDLL